MNFSALSFLWMLFLWLDKKTIGSRDRVGKATKPISCFDFNFDVKFTWTALDPCLYLCFRIMRDFKVSKIKYTIRIWNYLHWLSSLKHAFIKLYGLRDLLWVLLCQSPDFQGPEFSGSRLLRWILLKSWIWVLGFFFLY